MRDSISLLRWIITFLPKKVHDLNLSEFQKLLNNKHMWIIEFYLPFCQPCQKMEYEFAIAAQVNVTLL